MDAKDILRLLIQNRFWIVLFIAALLPVIGYVVTAGTVKEQAESKAAEIKSAEQGAQSYTSGTVPNGQYADFTQKKIGLIEKDVNEAHRRLYDRQAPLLDWPEEVAPQLTEWGRDIPEDISENETQRVAYFYSQVYDDYAKNVYDVVKPWDPIEGEGIVVVPPMESLLQTVTFDINNLPSIGKIWQYQENLWVRRSILEVIAEVNRKAGAKDWETAAIKQLTRLEVGNPAAVDHRTTALGFELKDPPEVTKGGQAIEPETPSAGGMAGMGGGQADSMRGMMEGGAGGASGMMPGMMEGMEGMAAMMGGMGGMGTSKGGGPVRFLQEDGVELFRDYPAYVSVLIDQNSIQNLLVEFENSPMTMRVLEANWTRPKTRVQPPVKGQGFSGYAGMGGFGMGMGGGVYGMEGMMPGMMGGMPGEMGMMQMQGMMGMPGEMGMMQMQGMMGMPGEMGMMPGMMGGRGMGAPSNQPRSRVKRDLAGPNQKKDGSEETEPEKVTIFDPYYNVVELQVYVQARFYYPPAPEAPADSQSPGEESTDALMTDDLADESLTEEPVDQTATDTAVTPDAALPTDTPEAEATAVETPVLDETPADPPAAETPEPEAVEEAPAPPADESAIAPADPAPSRF
ncbi:hypothetical protein [Tautonia rosea]|uniref:hypothetical protein n=1 Tax=Tautonia rosea TaxID=2728037 RepID=UPI00147650C7|nr:hypothetical protein [Tautonia rosea]